MPNFDHGEVTGCKMNDPKHDSTGLNYRLKSVYIQ
jgi:hypothetical protein